MWQFENALSMIELPHFVYHHFQIFKLPHFQIKKHEQIYATQFQGTERIGQG